MISGSTKLVMDSYIWNKLDKGFVVMVYMSGYSNLPKFIHTYFEHALSFLFPKYLLMSLVLLFLFRHHPDLRRTEASYINSTDMLIWYVYLFLKFNYKKYSYSTLPCVFCIFSSFNDLFRVSISFLATSSSKITNFHILILLHVSLADLLSCRLFFYQILRVLLIFWVFSVLLFLKYYQE